MNIIEIIDIMNFIEEEKAILIVNSEAQNRYNACMQTYQNIYGRTRKVLWDESRLLHHLKREWI